MCSNTHRALDALHGDVPVRQRANAVGPWKDPAPQRERRAVVTHLFPAKRNEIGSG